jgi:hypothetical protein
VHFWVAEGRWLAAVRRVEACHACTERQVAARSLTAALRVDEALYACPRGALTVRGCSAAVVVVVARFAGAGRAAPAIVAVTICGSDAAGEALVRLQIAKLPRGAAHRRAAADAAVVGAEAGGARCGTLLIGDALDTKTRGRVTVQRRQTAIGVHTALPGQRAGSTAARGGDAGAASATASATRRTSRARLARHVERKASIAGRQRQERQLQTGEPRLTTAERAALRLRFWHSLEHSALGIRARQPWPQRGHWH